MLEPYPLFRRCVDVFDPFRSRFGRRGVIVSSHKHHNRKRHFRDSPVIHLHPLFQNAAGPGTIAKVAAEITRPVTKRLPAISFTMSMLLSKCQMHDIAALDARWKRCGG